MAEVEIEVLPTTKRKESLMFDGHVFNKNGRRMSGEIVWRCKHYYTSGCPARCKSLAGILTIL